MNVRRKYLGGAAMAAAVAAGPRAGSAARQTGTTSRRNRLTIILAVIALTGAAAQPAAADNPAATYEAPIYIGGNYGDAKEICKTPPAKGVPYQYGAWGWYVDGCTTRRLNCPEMAAGCRLIAYTKFTSMREHTYRVTQNARTRAYSKYGTVRWHNDASCDSDNPWDYHWMCATSDGPYGEQWLIYPGMSATLQCNGVHGIYKWSADVTATHYCSLEIRPFY